MTHNQSDNEQGLKRESDSVSVRSDPHFSWLGDASHQKLLKLLASDGGEGRFVGSAVRNSFLGLPLSDFDVATTHPPHKVIDLLKKAGYASYPLGIEHGTVGTFVSGIVYEITTLRRDEKTDGRHADVSFTKNWREDALRRDFTMNALYVDGDGRLYDFVGGLADLRAGLVRFIGDPIKRIKEDYLRILRFFRFHAFYGKGLPDEASLKACLAMKDRLKNLSRNRIAQEIEKILCAPKSMTVARLFVDEGIWQELSPSQKKFCSEGLSHLLKVKAACLEKAPGIKFDVAHDPMVVLYSVYGDEKPDFLEKRAQKRLWTLFKSPLAIKNAETFKPSLIKIILKSGLFDGQRVFWCVLVKALLKEKITLAQAVDFIFFYEKWFDKMPPQKPLNGLIIKDFFSKKHLGFGGQKVGILLEAGLAYWAQKDFTPDKEELLGYLGELVISEDA